jgi:hypothetical protein
MLRFGLMSIGRSRVRRRLLWRTALMMTMLLLLLMMMMTKETPKILMLPLPLKATPLPSPTATHFMTSTPSSRASPPCPALRKPPCYAGQVAPFQKQIFKPQNLFFSQTTNPFRNKNQIIFISELQTVIYPLFTTQLQTVSPNRSSAKAEWRLGLCFQHILK